MKCCNYILRRTVNYARKNDLLQEEIRKMILEIKEDVQKTKKTWPFFKKNRNKIRFE